MRKRLGAFFLCVVLVSSMGTAQIHAAEEKQSAKKEITIETEFTEEKVDVSIFCIAKVEEDGAYHLQPEFSAVPLQKLKEQPTAEVCKKVTEEAERIAASLQPMDSLTISNGKASWKMPADGIYLIVPKAKGYTFCASLLSTPEQTQVILKGEKGEEKSPKTGEKNFVAFWH